MILKGKNVREQEFSVRTKLLEWCDILLILEWMSGLFCHIFIQVQINPT